MAPFGDRIKRGVLGGLRGWRCMSTASTMYRAARVHARCSRLGQASPITSRCNRARTLIEGRAVFFCFNERRQPRRAALSRQRRYRRAIANASPPACV
jgi:hypothetical protein